MKFNFMTHRLLNGDPGAGGGTGTPGTGAPGGNPNPAADWTASLPEDHRGYVQLKGFKDPASVVDSYRNLEKLAGHPKERLMVLPEKPDDAEGYNAIYSKLGRPEKPEEYKFAMKPEMGGETLEKGLKAKFHEAGLSASQAEKIAGFFGEYFDGEVANASAELQAKVKQSQESLQKEWGAAYEANTLTAQKAVKAFGISEEAIDALEDVMGFDGVHKFLHAVGSKLGEHAFHSGQGGGGFNGAPLTPAAAKAEIAQKMQDTAFFEKLQAGDSEAVTRWNNLNQWAMGSNGA